MKELLRIQITLERHFSHKLNQREAVIHFELDDILHQEEVL